MWIRSLPPAWPNGSAVRPGCRCAWRAKASHRNLARCCCAGTNHHLRLLQNGQLAYTAEPVNEIYRPSIDVFFESVARYWSGEAVGVLLTGMGRDGAQGLKMMRQRGFLTIAQDQASSAVYGMPKAAAAIDAAVEIRPLEGIAGRLTEIFLQ